MKLVRQHAAPVSADTGLFEVRDAVENDTLFQKQNGHNSGTRRSLQFLDDYLSHLRSFVDLGQLSKKRIVINANGGLAGQIAERLLEDTPIQVCKRLFVEPDGSFAQIPGGDPIRCDQRIGHSPQKPFDRQEQTWQSHGMPMPIGVFSLMRTGVYRRLLRHGTACDTSTAAERWRWCHFRSESRLGGGKRCYSCWGHTDPQPVWTFFYQGTHAKDRCSFRWARRVDTTISETISMRTTE